MILIASEKAALLSILLYFSIFICSIAAATANTTTSLPSLSTASSSESSEQSVSTLISTTSTDYSNYTSSSIYTSSTSQSYNASFTPVIPSSSDNQYIYHPRHIGGTVFIAVGSCLGFILLVLIAAWIIFGISAWNSARKEYKLKEIENKYQYDPFFFANGTDSSDNSINYSDGEDASDISEKVLKDKSSRLSLYSLGSTSVLNLLNQPHKDRDENSASIDGAMNNGHVNYANRNSLFISPTEILQNEANNSTLWNHSHANSSSLFDSATSTPREQLSAQIISNPNMGNSSTADQRNLYYHANNTSSTANLLSENMVVRPDYTLSPDSLNAKNITNERGGKKNCRPPSAYLDDLLNQDQDEGT